jgi:hypothetical protein
MAADEKDLHALEHPKFGHEVQDVNAYAITKFGIGLTLTIIVSMFVLWGLFNYFKSNVIAEFGGDPTAGVGKDARRMPPEPRLQSTPRLDLSAVRAAEDQILNGYAVVEGTKGAVRIPIDRAMEILAQRGLPARSEAPPAAGNPYAPRRSGVNWEAPQPGAPPAAGGVESTHPGSLGPLKRQGGERPSQSEGTKK